MPRYIDADKAKELWSGEHPTQIAMRKIFEELPTADVAPKSEVERLEAEVAVLTAERNNYQTWYFQTVTEVGELKGAYANYEETSGLKQAKVEVAREIFEEIDRIREETTAGNIMRLTFFERLAELKKKYTEQKGE